MFFSIEADGITTVFTYGRNSEAVNLSGASSGWAANILQIPVHTLKRFWPRLIRLTVALAISILSRRASGNDCTYQAAGDDESAFPGRFDLLAQSE